MYESTSERRYEDGKIIEGITTYRHYDENGNLTSSTERISIYRDNRVVEVRSKTEWFDEDGNLKSYQHSRTTYEYDASGDLVRVITETQAHRADGTLMYESTSERRYEDGKIKEVLTRSSYYDENGKPTYITEQTSFYENNRVIETCSTTKWFDEDGNLKSSQHSRTTYEYDENDKRTRVVTETQTHRADGTLMYESTSERIYEDGKVKEVITKSNYYDENGNLTSSTERISVYRDNRVVEVYSTTKWFDENGNLKSYQHSRTRYERDDNGKVVRVATETETYRADGTLRYESKSVTNYKDGQIFDTFHVTSYFDDTGKLIGKSGGVNVLQNGVLRRYTLTYDWNDEGRIIYTHVFDEEGKELDYAGGKDDVDPADIIERIRNPKILGEEILREDKMLDNDEVLQRKAIEKKVQAQANDPLFTGEMAEEKEEILKLLNRD